MVCYRKVRSFLVLACILACRPAPQAVLAEFYTVVSSGNAGVGTLRDAVDGAASNPDSTIYLSASPVLTNPLTWQSSCGRTYLQVMFSHREISGSEIILESGAEIFFQTDFSNPELTISSALSGSGSLIIDGGSLSLTGDNSGFSGTIDNQGRILSINSGKGLGTGTHVMRADSTLRFLNNAYDSDAVNANIVLDSGNIIMDTNGYYSEIAGVISGSGGLVIRGGGTLLLANNNTFTGDTVIESASLWLRSTNALQYSSVTLSNSDSVLYLAESSSAYTVGGISGRGAISILCPHFPSTLTVGGNNESTEFSGMILGPGSLAKTGSGTLTLSGTNYHQTTIVNNGTLLATTPNALPNYATSGRLHVDSGATLAVRAATASVGGVGWSIDQINQLFGTLSSTTGNLGIDVVDHDTFVFDTSITGNMGFCKLGTGTLTLSGANTYTGGTTVSGGTLEGNTVSLQGDIANNANVTFNQTCDGTYAGNMTGSGSLNKTGSGTLALTGVNTYTGPTTVSAGTLNVNGSLTSNVTVDSLGTINGNGTVGGLTVNGAVAPGNSIGTMIVNGDYVQNAGSTYQIEIDGNGQNDRIYVIGNATVGGAVEVTSLSPESTYTRGTTYNYTILAADSVSGTYDSLTMLSAFLDGSLIYGNDSIILSVARNGRMFSDVALTRNQRAVAAYLDDIEHGVSGDLATVFGGLVSETDEQVRASFDQLSGEPYADLAAINIAGANLFSDTAFYRMWNMDDFVPVHGRKLWAYGVGNWQRQYGADGYSGYDAPTSGFMVGCDNQFDNVLLGVAAGYGRSDVTFFDSPAIDRTDMLNFSTYGKADFDRVYVAGVVGYTRGWNDVTRNIRIETLAPRQTSCNANADLFGTLLQTGYNIDMGNWRLTPLAGLRYVHDSNAGGTETGADSINLSMSHYQCNSLSSHLGGKLGFLVNKRWRTEAYAQWEHEYADAAADVAMVFTGDATSGFIVESASSGRDGARGGLVAIGRLNDRIDLRFNYDSLLRTSYISQQLTGGLSIGF